MKQTFYILLLSIILFSCQQADIEYSCDPDINKFVIENKDELSQISVTQLANYDIFLQKAVFRSWDSEKKRTAWLEKLQVVLNSNSFTGAESVHLQKLINHIETGYFVDENILRNQESRAKFANEWLIYAAKDLGWSDKYISFLVYRLYTNPYQLDAELDVFRSMNTGTSTNPEAGSCNCNTSADFCSGSACRSTGCTISTGCGWLWSSTCNGNC